MTRYRLDPVFDRTPDGAVKGIIRYDVYLDGYFVGSRASTHYVTPTSMSSCTQPLNRAALRRLSMSYAAALLVVKVGNAPHDHRASTAITATAARVRILVLADVCDRSGGIEPRTGLRMMPTFPRSFLSFRTGVFLDRSPSPLLDITTTATGRLVWGFFSGGLFWLDQGPYSSFHHVSRAARSGNDDGLASIYPRLRRGGITAEWCSGVTPRSWAYPIGCIWPPIGIAGKVLLSVMTMSYLLPSRLRH
jgi:hypothetical protein